MQWPTVTRARSKVKGHRMRYGTPSSAFACPLLAAVAIFINFHTSITSVHAALYSAKVLCRNRYILIRSQSLSRARNSGSKSLHRTVKAGRYNDKPTRYHTHWTGSVGFTIHNHEQTLRRNGSVSIPRRCVWVSCAFVCMYVCLSVLWKEKGLSYQHQTSEVHNTGL